MCLQLLTFDLGSDLSYCALHESQFGYRQNFMLKETQGVSVLIMTSVELTVLFNLVFAATTNCMRQTIKSLTFSLNNAWKILANSPVICLFLLLSKKLTTTHNTEISTDVHY